MMVLPDESWKRQAACLGADPDLWFPVPGASTAEAKQICRECCVRRACLEYALLNREKHGIWGGKTQRERESLLQRRVRFV
jgi:WhiB family transcriptional regulator, redox-sensing transcriptional regulator